MGLWEILSARADTARATAQVSCGALGEVTVEALAVRELEWFWDAKSAADRDRGIFYAACRELQAAGAQALARGKVFRPDQVMAWVAQAEASAAARAVEALSGWTPQPAEDRATSPAGPASVPPGEEGTAHRTEAPEAAMAVEEAGESGLKTLPEEGATPAPRPAEPGAPETAEQTALARDGGEPSMARERGRGPRRRLPAATAAAAHSVQAAKAGAEETVGPSPKPENTSKGAKTALGRGTARREEGEVGIPATSLAAAPPRPEPVAPAEKAAAPFKAHEGAMGGPGQKTPAAQKPSPVAVEEGQTPGEKTGQSVPEPSRSASERGTTPLTAFAAVPEMAADLPAKRAGATGGEMSFSETPPAARGRAEGTAHRPLPSTGGTAARPEPFPDPVQGRRSSGAETAPALWEDEETRIEAVARALLEGLRRAAWVS